MSVTEDKVEEDPDYEACSSDKNKSLNVDPPVSDMLPSKNGKLLWFYFPLKQHARCHVCH